MIVVTGSSLHGHIHNKTGSRVKVMRSCGRGQWKVIEHRISFGDDEKVLERDNIDGSMCECT